MNRPDPPAGLKALLDAAYPSPERGNSVAASGQADAPGAPAESVPVSDILDDLMAAHLALRVIRRLATGKTPGGPVDDLAVIGNVADQALHRRPLEGDPGVYEIDVIVEREATRGSR